MLIIFGRHGQVAMELQRSARQRQLPFVAWSSAEANFTRPDEVVRLLREQHEPGVVVNAAAYTQVDLAESHADEALQINARTPAAIAEACRRAGHQLIHISTDYVFNGQAVGEYSETDLTGPTGVYGQTKLAGEQAILTELPSAIILRTSWVFSAHGKNFVKTMLRLGSQRDTLSVVNDQHGGPTSARSIAECCLSIAAALASSAPQDQFGGIYHFSGIPAATWAGFAEEIFRQTNLPVKVRPIATNEYPTAAVRPANSRLSCRKIAATFQILQPDWRADLAAVLAELNFHSDGHPSSKGHET